MGRLIDLWWFKWFLLLNSWVPDWSMIYGSVDRHLIWSDINCANNDLLLRIFSLFIKMINYYNSINWNLLFLLIDLPLLIYNWSMNLKSVEWILRLSDICAKHEKNNIPLEIFIFYINFVIINRIDKNDLWISE